MKWIAVLLLALIVITGPVNAETYQVNRIWNFNIPGATITSIAYSNNESLVAVGTNTNKLYLLKADTGVEIWNKTLNGSFTSDKVNATAWGGAINIDSILVACSNKTMYAINPSGSGTFIFNRTNQTDDNGVILACDIMRTTNVGVNPYISYATSLRIYSWIYTGASVIITPPAGAGQNFTDMRAADNHYTLFATRSDGNLVGIDLSGGTGAIIDTSALGGTTPHQMTIDKTTNGATPGGTETGYIGTSSSTVHAKTAFVITGWGTPALNTVYSYTSASGNPVTRPALSTGSDMGVEGRGSIVDIIRLDGTRVGTYTTGGTVNGVTMSSAGLWSWAVSSDGQVYTFQKQSSSSWTLAATTPATGSATAVDAIGSGLYAVVGRSTGDVTCYSVGVAGTNYATFYAIKDGVPYIGTPVAVYDLGVEELEYSRAGGGLTDSLGSYSLSVTYAHYYEVSVNSGEKNITILANPNNLVYYISIPGFAPTAVNYAATYNATAQNITLWFQNNTASDSVTWTIKRLSDGTTVTYTCTSALVPTYMNYQIPADFQNTSYSVTAQASVSGGTATNTWMIFTINGTGGGEVGPHLLPVGLDNYVKLAIGFILALCIGGVFSYLSGPLGALVTGVACGGLILFQVWPINMWGTVTLCIVWGFLGLVGKSSQEV